MANVLVTYAWVRSSYAALRNLAAHGVNVYMADSRSVGMGQWSRLSKGFDRYCSHYVSKETFIADIMEICQRREIDFILPSHNETEILAEASSRFPGSLSIGFPDPSHCQLFNNKGASYSYADSIGVPVPKRFLYDNPDSLPGLLNESPADRFVIKLLTGNSAKGVFYASTPEAARSVAAGLIEKHSLARERYPQVEEFVKGEGWGCSLLYWQGEQVANFTHRRLREKVSSGGTSTFRESAQHPMLLENAARLLSGIGFHGLAMVEFKVCPESGRHWFIEVNPRMWGSLSLATSAGVEFPYLLWLCASEGVAAARAYHANAVIRNPWKARWLLGEMFLFLKRMSRLEILDALSMIFQERADYLDDFFWDDPGAFLGEVTQYVSSAIRSGSTNPAEEGMLG